MIAVTPTIATDWMRQLGAHYALMRETYPHDVLCVVFDIDGTILDTRYLVAHLLYAYDREHGTEHFARLRPLDVAVHETQVEQLLTSFDLSDDQRDDIVSWYQRRISTPDRALMAHRPYRGVFDVIRWFQLQPDTKVAINTGRPELVREPTLAVLNAVGADHRVRFDPDLLCMSARGWGDRVPEAKVAGIDLLRAKGMRVVAMVDNEPDNLRAMSLADEAREILFLHADTIFTSQRTPMPATAVGSDYAIAGLVPEPELKRRVEFVWHGVNDADNLRQFLASDVHWAECDIRRDPLHRLVTRHDPFDDLPLDTGEAPLLLDEVLEVFHAEGRAIKLDLKEGADTLADTVRLIRRVGVSDGALWFNGSIEDLGGEGTKELRRAFPSAIISCPANFIAPLVETMPREARAVSRRLRRLGVSRLSLRWSQPGLRSTLDRLEEMGWDLNIYDVPDLAAFLEAALLLPRSVTADFNFPAWSYFGRGSGQVLGLQQG